MVEIKEELLNYRNQNKVRTLNDRDDYIFRTPQGKQNERLISKIFPKVVKKCGIKDFRFHDLRHTHASWQAKCGISQAITQKTLGHKSPSMTNRYSHLRDEVLRPALEQVGNKMLADYINRKEA